MSYIGNQPTNVAFLTDSFSGNGSTTAFTMQVAPANTSSVLVAISGVLQDPSTYSVLGTTLTFSAAPPTGTNNISVRYMGIPASGVTTTAYRTVTNFTATAGQTSFSVPSYTVGYIDVYLNGVRLAAADYTATNGTTVVLANAAAAGASVVTESFYVSSVLNAIPATAGAVNSTYIADGAVGSSKLAQSRILTPVQQPAGAVLQVIQSSVTGSINTTSSSLVATGLSATITPTSSSSKILVMLSGGYTDTSGTVSGFVQIKKSIGGGSNTVVGPTYVSSYYASGAPWGIPQSQSYLDSPATTSSTVYYVYFGATSGTYYINNSSYVPLTLTLMEIAA